MLFLTCCAWLRTRATRRSRLDGKIGQMVFNLAKQLLGFGQNVVQHRAG